MCSRPFAGSVYARHAGSDIADALLPAALKSVSVEINLVPEIEFTIAHTLSNMMAWTLVCHLELIVHKEQV
jgi:hypothetical protein